MQVSYFTNIKISKPTQELDIPLLLERIQNGTYQDIFFKVNTAKTKEERQRLKASLAPGFTTSGTFATRSKDNLQKHSGLIAIDVDDVEDSAALKEKISKDEYTYAAFISISGKGLCIFIKINPAKHLESFLAIEEYYFKKYGINIDRSCKDVSRFRYVSYDPALYHNPTSATFKELKKEVTLPRQNKYLHTQNKFERILNEIQTDIAPDYHEWVQIGFAIASEFGEGGRTYFHHISSYSPKYNQKDCDSKYTALLNSQRSGVTIASFYYFAKRAGITISSPVEREVEVCAYMAKTQGRNKDSVVKVLELKGIEPNHEIIDKVFESKDFNPIESNEKGAKINIGEVEQWLANSYNIKKNEVTRTYEMDGKVLESENLNSIYIAAKKMFDKLSRELWDTILFSEITPQYNPIKDYLLSIQWDGKERIRMLASAITSKTFSEEYKAIFLKKWLLGLVNSAINGEPNILMLILAGQKQGTGKSTFFKNLLPAPLKEYFAASQLDNGNDDKILLTQKLLILDDEYSGKSKKDSKHMKYVLSANQFDLREPYGKKNVRLTKMATLCGTTNDVQILNDPTGNRRIIIFEVNDVCDFDKYNKCDKEQLFAELVYLLQTGESCELTTNDIKVLNDKTSMEYSETCIEKELLLRYFAPAEKGEAFSTLMTATDIKVQIEKETNQKLYHKRLGMELTANGFSRHKYNGVYKYAVKDPIPQVEQEKDILPF